LRKERGGVKKYLRPRTIIGASAVIVFCALAYFAAPDPDHPAKPGPWYSVVPPLLAVTIAIVTGKIMISLVIAIVAGGLLNTVPADPVNPILWFEGLQNAVIFVWNSLSSPDNLLILAFVSLVLAMISVVIVAGGLHGIVQWLSRFAKGPRSAQAVTFLMGLAVFIDDYANTMIVGASMRPITDKFRVSREKLAFIVDCTSAPIAGLAIVSTWVGYEVGLFDETSEALALGVNGYSMLFDALPFRFYCVMMLIFVAINIASGKDYGPMKLAERRAHEEGEVAAADAVPMTSNTFSTAEPDAAANVRARSGVVPIAALFLFLLGSIWVSGGGMRLLSERPFALFTFTGWRDTISASNSIPLLAYSAAFGLLLAMGCAIWWARLPATTIGAAVLSGVRSSLLPVVILTLAWSIKEACTSLGTGPFLVAAVGESVNPSWFPAITFVIAGLTAFSTGTSYGTMAIMMPTAIPIAHALEGGVYGPITIISLAAILDGAILGDHCSPISDTTVMSSIASSCDHIHHVRTQLPYSLTIALCAVLAGYIPAGFGLPSWVSFLVAAAILVTLFAMLRAKQPAPAAESIP
jgi:Na+/H+ antiporter NhaC